ncbi:hypothetical protein C1645_817946 [Glomus cerebriforme]|uniref:Uncharacterized protein n=1 Tax=Glomus cerebriforme TaxID=658196 RepID=A0A397TDQ2_9GLOM|nr:hypothetical protein C1645_817946 [Glomus cerebriforme]
MNQPEIPALLPPSCNGISKRHPFETLNIPDTAFEQTGFVWRIQDKCLDKTPYMSTCVDGLNDLHFRHVIKIDWEFNAGMSSTQRVKSINAIIHKYVKTRKMFKA